MKIIIATIKSWNIERAKALQEKYAGVHEIVIYTKKYIFGLYLSFRARIPKTFGIV